MAAPPGGEYHYASMWSARLAALVAAGLVVIAGVTVPVAGEYGSNGVAVAAVVVAAAIVMSGVAIYRWPDAGVLFEIDTRQRFRAVCAHARLVIKDEAGRVAYPRLRHLVGRGSVWVADVVPLVGQSFAEWEKAGPRFALGFAATGVRFSDNGDGTIRLRVGYRPFEPVMFVAADSHLSGGPSWRHQLAGVAVGLEESGRSYRLPLLDTHILVAGMMGAGKSSVVWSLMLGLEPALAAGVVRLWGFDPKYMELSLGRSLFGDRYAAAPVAMVELLERAHAEMQARADELAGHARRFEPSVTYPLNVLVIDELGYLSALLTDRKLQARAELALSGILVLGRAVGYTVVGGLQDPRKSTIDFRDLFPTRVAMRLPAGMVDLVLGPGMREAGALCDLIPRGAEGAGVAFVVDEGSIAPVCVRMTWCSDELIISRAAAIGASSPGAMRSGSQRGGNSAERVVVVRAG